MQIYINGIKATKSDLATLIERVHNGTEYILEMRYTKKNNIAIITA